MKLLVPKILIYARLIMGAAMVLLSIYGADHFKLYAVLLLSAGLLSDIFDGIIARRLGVSTRHLRRMDSTVDQIFFIAVAASVYLQCRIFFKAHLVKLIILLGMEALTYIVSFIKFRKEIATHSIGAKIWTLLIFATLVEVILSCHADVLFGICFWVGMVTRAEIIAIILTLKNWTNDVPTVYHAVQLRKNREIRRHKLFNG